jgi:hypothetical protein
MKLTTLFRVETLDSRLALGSGTPLSIARRTRWYTPEYYVYYLALLTIPTLMFKSMYEMSVPSHPAYKTYEHLLSPGWILGRKVDNSDSQYSRFRENLPFMAILLFLHSLLRRLHDSLYSPQSTSGDPDLPNSAELTSARDADARLERRLSFDFYFALIYIVLLHGISAFKILTILAINYYIATSLPNRYAGGLTWIFNLTVLFANEATSGYRFAGIVEKLYPSTGTNSLLAWTVYIDSFNGLVPRWEILFNIAVLRLIAFNFDFIWTVRRKIDDSTEVQLLSQYSP